MAHHEVLVVELVDGGRQVALPLPKGIGVLRGGGHEA